MNIEHYQNFTNYLKLGLKKKAATSIRAFIGSFENENEISKWVWEYLPKLEFNRHSRIRHEIFQELIFPVLKKGYDEKDFNSTLWLGKLSQNIYQNQNLHKELDHIHHIALFQKCHKMKPENDEARLLLLQSIVRELDYSEHEWPSGILYGNDGANLDQCKELRSEALLASKLDKEKTYSQFIESYLLKLDEHEKRLTTQ